MGLFVGGAMSVAIGMGTVLLGSYFVASAAGRIDVYCDMPSIPCAHKDDGTRMTVGGVMMGLGGLLGAAGVPMWLFGSQWVYVPKSEKRPARLELPELRVGPAGGSVSLQF
jgi:hypothetical protein